MCVIGVGVLVAAAVEVAVDGGHESSSSQRVAAGVAVGFEGLVGVVVTEVGAGVKVLAGVFVTDVEVPTSIVPAAQEAEIAIPFASERINPLGAAGVARVVTVELPSALARKVILSNVPLPCAGGRFICAIA